jgi:hypothetical protein
MSECRTHLLASRLMPMASGACVKSLKSTLTKYLNSRLRSIEKSFCRRVELSRPARVCTRPSLQPTNGVTPSASLSRTALHTPIILSTSPLSSSLTHASITTDEPAVDAGSAAAAAEVVGSSAAGAARGALVDLTGCSLSSSRLKLCGSGCSAALDGSGDEPSSLAGLEDLLAVARLLELAVVRTPTTVLLEPSDPTDDDDDDVAAALALCAVADGDEERLLRFSSSLCCITFLTADGCTTPELDERSGDAEPLPPPPPPPSFWLMRARWVSLRLPV